MAYRRESGRRREIVPAIPFIYLRQMEGYVSAFAGSSHSWAWWATEFSTTDFSITYGKSAIQINTAGFYEITHEADMYLVQGTCSYCYVSIYYKTGETGSTYSEVLGTRAYCNLGDSDNPGKLHLKHFMYLPKGSKIYLSYQASADWSNGLVYCKSESERTSIKFVPMRGWNNSQGGAVNYRGGVMR